MSKGFILFWLLSLPAWAQWNSPGIGFTFCGTSNCGGALAQPASTQIVVAHAYPQTSTIGGVSVTWGWVTSVLGCSGPVSSVDRSPTTIDQRLAGLNYVASGNCSMFRVDLPASGTYNIDVAVGDPGANWSQSASIYDNTTSIWTIANNQSTSSGGYQGTFDATGALRANVNYNQDWVNNHALKLLTFATTTFQFKLGASSPFSTVQHLRIQQAGGGGGPAKIHHRVVSQ